MDGAESDPENGVTVYRVPADPAAGDALLANFEEGLVNAVGKSSARILMEGMEPRDKFGWYGKLDIKIKVSRNNGPDGHQETMVSWRCNDPASGQKVQGGQGTPKIFEKNFGRLIEFGGSEP